MNEVNLYKYLYFNIIDDKLYNIKLLFFNGGGSIHILTNV